MDESRPYYLEERQEEILSLLNTHNMVRIAELSDRFGVSEATIRKDMRALEDRGLLRRTHGGAILPNPNSRELSFEDASVTAQEEKQRIGAAAAKMVHDGDTFYLQSGTTTGSMLRALKGRRNLTIITCDLSHALMAEELLIDSEVILLGGSMRSGYHYTQGPETIRQLGDYFVPTAFLGTNTFSFAKGFNAHRLEQACMVRTALDSAERRVILMDSSKIGVMGMVHAADLGDINCLITDTGVDMDTRRRLVELAPNLEVIYA